MNTISPSENKTPALNRRTFLKSSGIAAAAAVTWKNPLTAAERARSIGANDRIRIAQIGVGNRGRDAHFVKGILPHVKETNFEVVAIADPWKKAREDMNAKVKDAFGREARAFASYKDLLALDGIDAVMIASPDHQHTTHLEAVAKANKHIYVEKPLATEFDKLLRAYDAAKAAQKKGSIIQVGTQLRSFAGVVGAHELMKTDILGKVSLVEENRNGTQPYWYSDNYLNRDIKEADVDWKEFLGDRKMRPFNRLQYAAWYGYYDFCQGAVPQWGAHFLDTVHYILGCGIPTSCVCLGDTFTWKDEYQFTTPDCVSATWIYPEGFMLRSSNNFGNGAGNFKKIFCANGTLDITNANATSYTAEGGRKRDGKIRGKVDVPGVQRPEHFLNWLQCMRSGETPHASIDAGYQHAVAVLMAVISYDTGRKTMYDAAKRKITTA
jgi:predicted dehydrogenase